MLYIARTISCRQICFFGKIEIVGNMFLPMFGKEIFYFREDVIVVSFSKNINNLVIASLFIYEMLKQSYVGSESAACRNKEIIWTCLAISVMTYWSFQGYLITDLYVLSQPL